MILRQTYVTYNHKKFFVSTIDRESGITECPGMSHSETVVWEIDTDSGGLGRMLYVETFLSGSLQVHNLACSNLEKYGRWLDEEEGEDV